MKITCSDCQKTGFEQCLVRIDILKPIYAAFNVMLCKDCIENRLQRKLVDSDFLPVPINDKFLCQKKS